MEAAVDAFLDEPHLARLTGRRQKSRQIEWLRNERIPFRINATGHPVVAWDALNGRQGQTSAAWTPKVLED